MSGKGVGANYMKLDVEFTLDQNVRVLVYQRSGEVFYRDDLDGVSGAFVKMYPNHKKKFLFPTDLLESITE